jgi:type 1 glutamine amidotransferase
MWRSLLSVVTMIAAAAGLTMAAAVPEKDVEKMTAAIPKAAPAKPAKARKVLIYSVCGGFVHGGAIDRAKIILPIMGEKTGAYTAVVSDDLDNFMPDKLKEFDLVMLNNTTGDLFKNKGPNKPNKPNKPDATKITDADKLKAAEEKYEKDLAACEKAMPAYEEALKKFKELPDRSEELRKSFMDWVKAGHGVFGNHAATDCSYNWKEYGEMIGGYFAGHPWSEKVTIKNDDPTNTINAAFEGKGFEVPDEMYIFRDPYSRKNQRVLLSIDMEKSPKKKGRADDDNAVSWLKMHGQGRIFYCSLGHFDGIFWNPAVLAHYLAGMQWAMGDLQAEITPNPLAAPAAAPAAATK